MGQEKKRKFISILKKTKEFQSRVVFSAPPCIITWELHLQLNLFDPFLFKLFYICCKPNSKNLLKTTIIESYLTTSINKLY